MLRDGKAAPKRRSNGATTATKPMPKAAQSFDPTAYAALVAIAAAEQRLRASHSRAASSVATARPSSEHRPSSEPALDSLHLQLHDASIPRTARDGRTVEDIVARYRPTPPPPQTSSQLSPQHHTHAATSAPTLLEQLALESESSSSVASDSHTDYADFERQSSTQRSASPPAAAPPLPRDDVHLQPSSSASASSSPPAVEPAFVAHKACSKGEEKDEEGVAAVVSLRDASPLRERSVSHTAGISYRVATVERVHRVAQQLNFALYQ